MCMINVSCSIIYESCTLPELLGTLLYDCVRLNQQGCQFHTSSWANEQSGSTDPCWTDKEIGKKVVSIFFVYHSRISSLTLSISDRYSYRAFWPHLFPSQCSARVAVTFVTSHRLWPLKASQTRMSRHLGLSTKTPTYLGQRTEPGRALLRQQPPTIPTCTFRSAIWCSWYLLNIPCIHFIPFSFLIQNIALHYIQFIKAAKYFTAHIIAFISQTTSPVTSHQLIFHGHILIDINCITSPYLRISQVLYHSFHYFAGLADL